MGFIISVYSIQYFREYVLPVLNNADYVLHLHRKTFHLKADLALRLEVIDGRWRICPSPACRIYASEGNRQCVPANREDSQTNGSPAVKEIVQAQPLYPGALLRVETENREQLVMQLREVDPLVAAYAKYDLNGHTRVTIGKDDQNMIRYDCRGMVSSEHACFVRQNTKWFLQINGRNGLYVNGEPRFGSVPLAFGDFINIIGLHLVFLDKYLAVDTAEGNAQVTEKLKEVMPWKRFSSCDMPEKAYRHGGNGQRAAESVWQEAGEALRPERGMGNVFRRSPRDIEKPETTPIAIEAPPAMQTVKKQPVLLAIGPSFTMAVPMLLGCLLMIYASRASGADTGLFMYSGLVMSISSAAMGTFWAVMSFRYRNRSGQKEEELRKEAYGKYLEEKEALIRERAVKTAAVLNEAYPEASVLAGYGPETPQLWNRNTSQEDFLHCRLGNGSIPLPAQIQIPPERFSVCRDELESKPGVIRERYKSLHHVPVQIDLVSHSLVGIIGGKEKGGAFAVAELLMIQIAAVHCYTDVKIAVLYDSARSEDQGQWDFVRWLPHVWSEGRKMRYTGSDKREISDISCELAGIFRRRRENQGVKKEHCLPHIVLFLSDAALIEDELIAKYVFDKDKTLGLTTLILSDTFEGLPNACDYVIQNDGTQQGLYSLFPRKEECTDLVLDTLPAGKAERFARTLCGLRVQEPETGGELPASVTFFEMYGISDPGQLHIPERWLKNRTYDSIRGRIGEKTGGVPCFLDLHEKYHGPHGLIAGTTGSGKSETLQTFILSLALNYSPDDLGFFIIDYKGGGMAGLFTQLPHLLGQISNLSGNQIRRAMVSIKSENRRRQSIFNAYGVNHIDAYTRLVKRGEAAISMPHLLIIIDEFAELKKEEPDFMRELISVAQVGRSLGVHLILATQKPGGTVDDHIRSNSRFRLCLRVQDREDSMEMLHRPDAAALTQAGRGFLQVGNDEVYEQFQSGWSGAPYRKGVSTGTAQTVRLLTMTGKIDTAGRISPETDDRIKNKSAREKAGVQREETTQLDILVSHLAAAAADGGYHAQQLWLPVLPEKLYLDAFAEYRERCFSDGEWNKSCGEKKLETVIGLMDDPENQAQFPLRISFSENGHLAVIGAAACGKSTFLQTLVYALVTQYTPEELVIYGIDYSSRLLCGFLPAPHVGGIVTEGEDARTGRLLRMLGEMLQERKSLFRGGNYNEYIRVHGIKLPAVLLVIDHYPAFREKTGEVYDGPIAGLLREGMNYGIFLAVSAGGIGMSELPGRIAGSIPVRICLELGDRYAYADVLHTMKISVLPEKGIKGRGLACRGGEVLEYQTALAFPSDNDYQRSEEIAGKCEQMKAVWTGPLPRPVPEIPEKPVWDEFRELEQVKSAMKIRWLLPVGYVQDTAGIYSMDLRSMYCCLVTGAVRTGKHNFMKVLILSALEKGAEVIVAAEDTEEDLLPGEELIRYLHDADELFAFFSLDLMPVFQERNRVKRDLEQGGLEEEEVFEALSAEKMILLCISDLAWFVPLLYADERGMGPFMENLIRKGAGHNIYFIGLLEPDRRQDVGGYPVFTDFLGYQTGIHFGGNTAACPLLNFDYLGYERQSAVLSPGIALLPDVNGQHDAEQVVIPRVRKGVLRGSDR